MKLTTILLIISAIILPIIGCAPNAYDKPPKLPQSMDCHYDLNNLNNISLDPNCELFIREYTNWYINSE